MFICYGLNDATQNLEVIVIIGFRFNLRAASINSHNLPVFHVSGNAIKHGMGVNFCHVLKFIV